MIPDYDQFRPLLAAARDRDLDVALAAYDGAVDDAGQASLAVRPPGARRAEAERAYRDEALAAAIERREPRLEWSSVEAAVDDPEAAERATVAAQMVTRRAGELTAVMRAKGVELLQVIARERAGWLPRAKADERPPAPLERLYAKLLIPPLAYGPGQVGNSGRLHHWWPLELGGWIKVAQMAAGRAEAQLQHQWNEWAWAMLAQRGGKAFTITDEGLLQFHAVWQPPERLSGEQRRLGFVAVAQSNREPLHRFRYEPGDVVMIGTGPNGEQGVGPDDVAWLQQATTYRDVGPLLR